VGGRGCYSICYLAAAGATKTAGDLDDSATL